MQETFKPGDVVQLKSGGPTMTVDAVGDVVGCKWFTDDGRLNCANFLHAMLEKYEPPKPITMADFVKTFIKSPAVRCTCPSADLMTCGCRCGAVKK